MEYNWGLNPLKGSNKSSKWVSTKSAPETITDDVIEYPEMVMARTVNLFFVDLINFVRGIN